MKLQELQPEQLDEIKLRHAAAAAAAAAAIGTATPVDAPHGMRGSNTPIVRSYEEPPPKKEEEPQKELDPHVENLVGIITKKYRDADPALVREIVELAHKYERETFPKAQDILAVIGVESRFDPEAKSGLRTDPALGLMQVRPGVWKLEPEDLEDMENQVKIGSDILAHYYRRYRDKRTTLMAYNAGPTGKEESEHAPIYADKVMNELRLYTKR